MQINGSPRQLRAQHDTVRRTLSNLKNLDISTISWDPILFYIIRRKLDHQALAALEYSADASTEVQR